KGFQRLHATFDGTTGPFAQSLVEQAESLFAELLASSSTPMLLHGDLHHWNILAAERAPWLALDPKGVAGEPAYEVGAWMRNPVPQVFSWPNPERLLRRRADIFAEHLGFDRQRLLAWSMAQAVLSAWWSYEDHGRGWGPMMAWAELLAHLL
ncbi:MAG TPA: aminoglycoside phosphotransferase family protein, partial [Ktedonobacterales bacterium]|nr:aminoglycoside phosphotransferase family protein [Ktedonobacterales bacterium]